MDATAPAPTSLTPIVDFATAQSDPVVSGLERKLDVLRAQLAASRAGQDPGDAGIAMWSRLEHQSLQIDALRTEITGLRQTASSLVTERDALAARLHEADADSDRHAADRLQRDEADQRQRDADALQREADAQRRDADRQQQAAAERQHQRDTLRHGIEAGRMQDELRRNRQTILTLSQSLLDAPPSGAASTLMPAREALLHAVLASSSWRMTRPLRRLLNRVKGRRDAVL